MFYSRQNSVACYGQVDAALHHSNHFKAEKCSPLKRGLQVSGFALRLDHVHDLTGLGIDDKHFIVKNDDLVAPEFGVNVHKLRRRVVERDCVGKGSALRGQRRSMSSR